jgi:hypothetical protein
MKRWYQPRTGAQSLYTVWVDRQKNQLLAELPRNWQGQKFFIAVTQASGGVFAGLQGPSRLVYWKRYDNRLALIEPELETRSTGEPQSKASVERLFTDRVLTDVGIVCIGPNGQPVIDLDDLLVGKAGAVMGMGGMRSGGGAANLNTRLASVTKLKAFPENVEIAVEVPSGDGQLMTFYYSISQLKDNPNFKPREADERVGYSRRCTETLVSIWMKRNGRGTSTGGTWRNAIRS